MTYPAPPACLSKPYSAKPGQKGGTRIAEDVFTREDHHRRLADPDAYRPECCEHCGRPGLHAHDFRTRLLRADPRAEKAVEWIRRFLCPLCGAVWQVLPAFIARNLHRSWEVVQSCAVDLGEVEGTGAERRVFVPGRTRRRWRARLRSSAVTLTQILAAAGRRAVEVLGRTGVVCNRATLIDALAAAGLVEPTRKIEQIAGWIHRLVPGIRLM